MKRGFGICFMPSAEERRRQPNASTRVVEDDVVGARPSTNLELLFLGIATGVAELPRIFTTPHP